MPPDRLQPRLLALLALLALAACRRGADPQPSVLLITVDTLRADRLGTHGYPLPTTPRLDALAAEGVRFADCTVQWPKTWPSMASFLAGRHPKSTGIRLARKRLPDAALLIPEVFAGAGYRTGAVVSNFNLGRRFGFDQGFEHFEESWMERWSERSDEAFVNVPGLVKLFTNATAVTDQGLAWLRGLGEDEPFFLWLHYMDPHGPYLPPREYAGLFEGHHAVEEVPAAALPEYQLQRRPGDPDPITDLGFYRTQYDREVRYFDDELGRLLDEVAALGRGGDLLTVFGADHGESLGEHRYYLEHGRFSYQVNAHTPLILHWPGRLQAGRVVEAPVGMIDVAPTLLELAGLPVPDAFQGTSLAGLAQGAAGARAPEYVFMESGEDEDAPQLTVRRGPWKLIRVLSPLDRQRTRRGPVELYDLSRDPGEERDLARERPDLVRELRRVVMDWYEGLEPPAVEPEPVRLETLSEDDVEMLEALGYH